MSNVLEQLLAEQREAAEKQEALTQETDDIKDKMWQEVAEKLKESQETLEKIDEYLKQNENTEKTSDTGKQKPYEVSFAGSSCGPGRGCMGSTW